MISKMLGEAFLCRVGYEDSARKDKKLNRENNNKRMTTGFLVGQPEDRSGCLTDEDSLDVFQARDQILRFGQSQHVTGSTGDQYNQCYRKESSEAMFIPKKDRNGENQLDLYTSWSSMYASIYKNYPDMHIAGHHILNRKDSGCVLDLHSELQDGPVLLSVDIAANTPPTESLDKPAEPNSEEKRDRSITVSNAPFSNSVLSGYMEKQMQELYKQLIEEHQVVTGSPNPMLFSGTLINNVNQISAYLSQEQNVECCKARQAILNCLRSGTSGISSEFITPTLHISSADHMKNPDAWSKYSAVLRSSALRK